MIRRLFHTIAAVAWYLPGFLLWAAFPPMGENTDCLFALAPLLWLSRRADTRTCVRRWFLNGLLFWAGTLSWMPAIADNGGPWALVVLGWFGLAAYCAAYFAAFGYLSAKVWDWVREAEETRRRGWYARRLFAAFVAEPVLWAGLELVRSRLFGGFAWNQLGVAMVNSGFGSPAAFGGVYLVSALVLLVNGSIAGIAERVMRKVPRYAGIETLATFATLLGVYAFAGGRLKALRADCDAASEVRVALVQRNFPCCFQRGANDPIAAYSNLLSRVSAFEPDLVVLPESAFCEFGAVDSRNAQRVADWMRGVASAPALLAGGSRKDGTGLLYNSAALFGEDTHDIYDKVHLVPFGEFIPGDKWFPALQKLAPVGSCTPGEPKVLPLRLGGDLAGETMPLGVAICFEDTDSALVRTFAARGARALAFITNDSWFSHSEEALQHAWQATARAIETGLPVVRVGNSGVSCVILPDGSTSTLADADGKPLVDRRGTLVETVPLLAETPDGTPRTPYVRLGDGPLLVVFILLLLGLTARGFMRRGSQAEG